MAEEEKKPAPSGPRITFPVGPALAMRLYQEGMSVKGIAAQLKRDPREIENWLAHFDGAGQTECG
jgi:hypothetical protein